MPITSITNSETDPGIGEFFLGDKHIIALVNEEDFVLARRVIEDFTRWQSFNDFVSERDGYLIGLSCAGQNVRQVEVRMRDFLHWSLHSGIAPSLHALDTFAACVHAFRANPRAKVKGVPVSIWREKIGRVLGPGNIFKLPISTLLYHEWLATMARVDICRPIPSLDVYARNLLEIWADLAAS